MNIISILLFVTITTPNAGFTPGCLCTKNDPDFDGYIYKEHIAHCIRRLPTNVIKLVMSRYNINIRDKNKYEFDRLIPVSMGGSNNACNIWPQRLDEAYVKNELEFKIYKLLKLGDLTQRRAIMKMLAWK